MKEGWKYKKLGEVIDHLRTGLNPRTHFKLNTPDAEGYYITVRELKGFSIEPDEKTDKVNSAAIKRINERSNLKPGDVLFSGTGTIGKTALVNELPENWNIKEGVYAMTPKHSELNSKYFIYYIGSDSFLHLVNDKATGTGVRSIPMKELVKLPISVPPLPEQERIVERLDAAFAQIDELKSNAEKQLAEARALFQSALTQAMQPKPGWQVTTIGDICEIVRGKRFVRADIVDDGVPCIHYGDIYTYYGLSVTKTRGYLNPELAKKMRFAKKNDVVVVQAGENNWDIGVGVAYFGEEPAAVHDACFILRHKQDPMFLSYYLRSYNYHWYLLDYVHEGKICSFLKPALEKAPIPLPPLSEQHSIVSTLDSLISKVDRLQEIFNKVSQECDALKQAILRQIFE